MKSTLLLFCFVACFEVLSACSSASFQESSSQMSQRSVASSISNAHGEMSNVEFVPIASGVSDDFNTVRGSNDAVWMINAGGAVIWANNQLKMKSFPTDNTGFSNDGDFAGCGDSSGTSFRGAVVNSDSDIWIGCDWPEENTGVLHWDGKAWKYSFIQDNRNVGVLWATGQENVWGFGYSTKHDAGYVGHFDGKNWSHVSSPIAISAIWGSNDNQIWATCSGTTICHGQLPNAFEDANTQYAGKVVLNGIWGSGPTNVWAVGDSATILQYDGKKWVQVQSSVTVDLKAIWGTRADDIWAVGGNGTILHFDGRNWIPMKSASNATLRSVWISPSGEIWIVGDHGTILHGTSQK